MSLLSALIAINDDGIVDEHILDVSGELRDFIMKHKRPGPATYIPRDPEVVEWAIITGRLKHVPGYEHIALRYQHLTDCMNIIVSDLVDRDIILNTLKVRGLIFTHELMRMMKAQGHTRHAQMLEPLLRINDEIVYDGKIRLNTVNHD